MNVSFQKAKREKVYVKVLIGGPSGSGKTYSALRLATGIAEESGSRVAAIDTERGRIRYYADEFDFDDVQLDEYSPESYIEAIKAAVDAGYKVLIIDSLSHEWTYCTDIHSKMPGNSYTNWAKISPRHDKLMELILQSPLHIISTARGKDEYVLEDKNGKQVPKKVGKGIKQRDNTEYEYTVVFNVDLANHVADVSKDNTHLFEGRYEMLTEADGRKLYAWANSGATKKAAPKPKKTPDETADKDLATDAGSLKKELVALAKKKAAAGVPKEKIGEISKNICGSVNFNKETDPEKLMKIIDEVKKIKED